MADINITLVKSLIGSTKQQIATANALGLRKIGDKASQPDNAATKGKINKLQHLIQTAPADQGGAK